MIKNGQKLVYNFFKLNATLIINNKLLKILIIYYKY